MRSQVIIQLVLIITAIVIIVTVVRPMFAGIRADQDEMAEYQQAIDTVDQFNQRLSSLKTKANGFSANQLAALDTFIPNEIDELSVSRDLVQIAEQNQLLVVAISAERSEDSDSNVAFQQTPDESATAVGIDGESGMGGTSSLATEAQQNLDRERFALTVLGTYDQLKNMLTDLERNAYPLRLVQLTIAPDSESQLYSVSLAVEAYALNVE